MGRGEDLGMLLSKDIFQSESMEPSPNWQK
jgi:hypothetical protein